MLARLPMFLSQAAVVLLLSATPTHAQTAPTTALANPQASGDSAHSSPNMEKRALACTGCHGKLGVATADGYFPRIAGKPAGYLLNQLRHFKSGARRFDGMNRLVESLPDDYLRQFADYFSALDLPYPAPESQRLTAAETKRAIALVNDGDSSLDVPACKSCHGSKLTGVLPAVPGLLGLPRDYLTAQLGAWKNGLRNAHQPDCMKTVVDRLPAEDLTAVAGWLAAQAVPKNSKPLTKADHREATGKAPITCGSDKTKFAKSATNTFSKAPSLSPDLRNGRYLVRLGNCAACHSQADELPGAVLSSYGGGIPIETPFGRVFGSNISSSRPNGIGAWGADSFFLAMTQGIGEDGAALNPVFPYQFFAGLNRSDSDAMLHWLQASAPIEKSNLPHELRFPFGTQLALSVWRWLYVDEPSAPQTPPVQKTPSIERGRYLVDTVMHCNACHGERNFMGGFTQAERYGGQKLPGDAGYAPSLDAANEAGLVNWSLDDIEAFLLTGHNRHADANGLMGRVVHASTQYLNAIDVKSTALYLKSGIAAEVSEPEINKPSTTNEDLKTRIAASLPLWQDNCATCHADNGQGKDDLGPPLAGRRSVQVGDPSNIIISILHGGFGPVTSIRPYPPGMPGFAHRLTDQQVATLATYIRQSWGNKGSQVRAVDVQRLR